MCYQAMPYIAMAIGAAATVAGQNQQRNEAKRAQAAQDQFNAMQKKMVLDKQAEENQFSQRKQQSVLNEAEVVAPDRVQQVQQAADTQTASNVNALQQANLLGEESVAQGAQGNQSNAYLKARAEAAAKQTDQAIKLARLFGATGAGNTAVANQAQNALDHRLNQQAIDANRRSMQRGYQWMFDDLALRGNKAAHVDASKGQTAQALGGLLMSYGGNGIGTSMGNAAGSGAAAGNYFMNLNNSRVG
ncbi:hypothetical protein GMD41_14135 [Parasutterella excrementihominis]|nr:hypothetical protein [Parasutterella excrementihominis]